MTHWIVTNVYVVQNVYDTSRTCNVALNVYESAQNMYDAVIVYKSVWRMITNA